MGDTEKENDLKKWDQWNKQIPEDKKSDKVKGERTEEHTAYY